MGPEGTTGVISLPKCQENRKDWILDRRFREGLKNKRLVLEETSHIEEFGTSPDGSQHPLPLLLMHCQGVMAWARAPVQGGKAAVV